MRLLSVNRVLTIGWVIIGFIAFFSIAQMIAIAFLSTKYDWPAYASVPLAMMLPVASTIVCFQYAAKKWIAWAYLHVTDVIELQKASQISGFGAYSVDKIRNKATVSLIKARIAEYEFHDDVKVPFEIGIYNNKPYQNFFFILMLGGTIFTPFTFVQSKSFDIQTAGIGLVIPLFFAVAAFVTYYKSSDRQPQIILSEVGINANGLFCEWKDITDYEVTQGKTSQLTYICNGVKNEIIINNWKVSKVGLNHLLHVYSYRNKNESLL